MNWLPAYTTSLGIYVKIGLSQDPEDRKKELQTGNPFVLTVKEFYEVKNMKEAEEAAHEVAKTVAKTVEGGQEWFRLQTLQDLDTLIKKVYITMQTFKVKNR